MGTFKAENPLGLELTATFLRSKGMRPLIVGDDQVLRFQVLDEDGNPEDLSDAKIVMSIRLRDVTVTRTTGVAIADAAPARDQIALDDQSTELAATGKGWLEVRFASTPGEVEAFKKVVGLPDFDLVRELPGGDEKTVARGRIEILPGVTARPI
jgi:hypothetical protein